MQILITTSVFKQPRVLQFTPWSVMLVAVLLIVPVMMVTAMAYHSLLMQATRINLPVVSDAARFLQKNERDRRERYMRENLDAMAVKVGELHARLVWLETVSERVAGMAGIKPEEFQVPETGGAGASAPAGQSGQGGPYAPLRSALQQPSKATLEALREEIDLMNQQGEQQADVLTLIESRLFEKRLDALMVPSSAPVAGGVIGSGFGFRSDPFRGTRALHTGLDFPAPTGTPIGAAAGGVVLTGPIETLEHRINMPKQASVMQWSPSIFIRCINICTFCSTNPTCFRQNHRHWISRQHVLFIDGLRF